MRYFPMVPRKGPWWWSMARRNCSAPNSAMTSNCPVPGVCQDGERLQFVWGTRTHCAVARTHLGVVGGFRKRSPGSYAIRPKGSRFLSPVRRTGYGSAEMNRRAESARQDLGTKPVGNSESSFISYRGPSGLLFWVGPIPRALPWAKELRPFGPEKAQDFSGISKMRICIRPRRTAAFSIAGMDVPHDFRFPDARFPVATRAFSR